jgi:preprotein translocase subunit SecD
MNPLLKNWQLTLLVGAVIIAIFIILFMGVKLGLDFKGGTLYQIELQQQVGGDEISRIGQIISQRIDPSGLQDVIVTPVGGQFIIVQLSETNPIELEKIESRIRQQGKFEATLNGEILFTGDEIKKVLRGDNYYGVFRAGTNLIEWRLPFVLDEKASRSFTEKTFHQCSATSFTPDGKAIYECEKTFFFLDKPNALIVISEDQYNADADALYVGNVLQNIPEQTDIEELIEDSQVNVLVYFNAESLDSNIIASALTQTQSAIISPDLGNDVVIALEEKGFTVVKAENEMPWLWNVLKARQVISLTENVTNEDVVDVSQATVISTLVISGRRADADVAKADLEELTILLESGSLPTPVKSISKETISPSLGEAFLSNIIIMGIIAFLTVAAVIVIRYRILKLAIPILIIGASEVLLNLGFIALMGRPLDLAAFAGLIAAIGTGVDSEVVITDEIMGRKGQASMSLIQRVRSAMFIIMTSAFTIIGVMGPIVLLSRNYPGLDKLFGFAVVAIVGALIGVLITRPAFTKIIEKMVSTIEKNKKE